MGIAWKDGQREQWKHKFGQKQPHIWADGALPLQTKKETLSKPLSSICRIKNKTKNRKNRDFSGHKIVFNFLSVETQDEKTVKYVWKVLILG
jgi:hypothetical protein